MIITVSFYFWELHLPLICSLLFSVPKTMDHSVSWLFQILIQLNDWSQQFFLALLPCRRESTTQHTPIWAAFEGILCARRKIKWKLVSDGDTVEPHFGSCFEDSSMKRWTKLKDMKMTVEQEGIFSTLSELLHCWRNWPNQNQGKIKLLKIPRERRTLSRAVAGGLTTRGWFLLLSLTCPLPSLHCTIQFMYMDLMFTLIVTNNAGEKLVCLPVLLWYFAVIMSFHSASSRDHGSRAFPRIYRITLLFIACSLKSTSMPCCSHELFFSLNIFYMSPYHWKTPSKEIKSFFFSSIPLDPE